ncbi:MAG: ribokinase [Chloroflexi bacterium]|nr:ribokinase [Chloroflexota bacterium]
MNGHLQSRGGQPLVVVVGAANVDTKGRVPQPPLEGTSIPGEIRTCVGGVARNIAENLCRLGVQAVLLSAVGADGSGQRILTQAASNGLDVSQVIRSPEHHTAAYLTVLDAVGKAIVSIDDTQIMELITPSYIYAKRSWFRRAAMVVLDANVPPRAMEMVFRLTAQYHVPVCADPTSVPLCERLLPHLDRLHIITPNVPEAERLTGCRITHRESGIRAARRLVAAGVQTAIVTRSDRGVVYATPKVSGHVPALEREAVDRTGVGDALTAGVVFGLLNSFPIDEAMRLGVSAAALALQSRESVHPDLSLERLYDELVI